MAASMHHQTPDPQKAAGERRPAVVIHDLAMTFGVNRALDNVSLTIAPGEIHVLAGSNGSGKSTLIKILSGYYAPDPGGEVLIDGEPLAFSMPTSAYRLGCRFVHQDLGLIATGSVLDNLSFTAGYPTVLGTIRSAAAKRSVRAALEQVGLGALPLNRTVSEVSAAERTGVAVARAIRADEANPVKLIVLDEPTATMPADEVERLLGMIAAIAGHGVAVLLVTHHLDEVFRVADRITVLRDGLLIATSPVDAVDHDSLVEQLTGDVVEPVRPGAIRQRAEHARFQLEVNGLRCGPLSGLSFAAHEGEILGLAGLTGSGRESVLGAVFGRTTPEAGAVLVDNKPLRAGRPDLAIRAGVAYLPSERKTHGGVMELSARENIVLSSLQPFFTLGRIDRRAERAEARDWFTRLGVRPAGAIAAPLASFSGGNQQKILFGKWIRNRPKVFLLDEPTQGVDVGAKAELHRQLLKLANDGTTVVVSSIDHEELATICDRVLVLRGGHIVEELVGTRLTATEINRSALATSPPTPSCDKNEVLHP
ncbi:hypothetical protein B5P43_32675 [Bacillus sp. SRB_336]|nr:hypothetical protein B5P43_32675 [Bacillus sp. SRB_336]